MTCFHQDSQQKATCHDLASEVCCVSAHQPGRHRQDVEWHSGGLRRWVVPNSEAQRFFFGRFPWFSKGMWEFLGVGIISMVGNVWGFERV